MVAVQRRRFSGEDGKADIEGVGCIIKVMSSVCRLQGRALARLALRRHICSPAETCSEASIPFSDALCICATWRYAQFRGFVCRGLARSRILGIFHSVLGHRVGKCCSAGFGTTTILRR